MQRGEWDGKWSRMNSIKQTTVHEAETADTHESARNGMGGKMRSRKRGLRLITEGREALEHGKAVKWGRNKVDVCLWWFQSSFAEVSDFGAWLSLVKLYLWSGEVKLITEKQHNTRDMSLESSRVHFFNTANLSLPFVLHYIFMLLSLVTVGGLINVGDNDT